MTKTSTMPFVREAIGSPGQPLDSAARAFMEPRFGHSFSHVRIHSGALAEESARAIGAAAYTLGRDVVFGAGQYQPLTPQGRLLLAHELAHVLQARQANADASKAVNLSVAPFGHPVEREANRAAEQATMGLRPLINSSVGAMVCRQRQGAAPTADQSTAPQTSQGVAAAPTAMQDAPPRPADPASELSSLWECHVAQAFRFALVSWIQEQIRSLRQRVFNRPRALQRAIWERQIAVFEDWLQQARTEYRSGCPESAQPEAEAAPGSSATSRPGLARIDLSRFRESLRQLSQTMEPAAYESFLRNFTGRIYSLIGAGVRHRHYERILANPSMRVLNDLAARIEELNRARTELSNIQSMPNRAQPLAARRNRAAERLARARRRLGRQPLIEAIESVLPETGSSRLFEQDNLEASSIMALERDALRATTQERQELLRPYLSAPRTADSSHSLEERLTALGEGYQSDAVYHQILVRGVENIARGVGVAPHETLIVALVNELQRLHRAGHPEGPTLGDIGIRRPQRLSLNARERHGVSAFDVDAPMNAPIQEQHPESLSLAGSLPASFPQRENPFVYQRSEIQFAGSDVRAREARFRLQEVLNPHPRRSIGEGRGWELVGMEIMTDNAGTPGSAFASDPESTTSSEANLRRRAQEFNAAQQSLRLELQNALRNRLRVHMISEAPDRLSIDPLIPISPGQPIHHMVNPAFVSNLRSDSRGRGGGLRQMVLAEMVQALREMSPRSPGRLQRMAASLSGVPPEGPGGRAVNIAHLYTQQGTNVQRWVVVLYSHLSSLAPGVRTGSPVPGDGIIGTVGASGNAVTAHVHLEVHVRERRDSETIFWLSPYDFFPTLQAPTGRR